MVQIKNRVVFLFSLFVFSSIYTEKLAAQNKVSVDVEGDLVSGYVWRGQKLGGVSLQPAVNLNYGGFTLGAWGSYGFNLGDHKEIDVVLGYSYKGLSLGVTDYWCDPEGVEVPSFFHYKAHETAHVFEGNVGLDFNVFTLSWNTNFAGGDYFGKDDKRSYSSYVEIAAPFKIGSTEWSAEVGATPWRGAYASEFAVVNVGLGVTKTLQITPSFSLPIAAKLIANPSTEALYFVFGIHL